MRLAALLFQNRGAGPVDSGLVVIARSAFLTHSFIVCAVQPIMPAIDTTATTTHA